MRTTLFTVLLAFLLGGCASSPLPEGYTGPTAHIADSVTPIDTMKAYCFWVSKVDGRQIETSPGKTRQVNYGRGLYMEPQTVERAIPAQKVTLTLEASRIFAADILALTNKSYSVTGEVEFVPKVDGRYVVKGVISPSASSVWIEDANSGEIVSKKIEKKRE